MVTVNCEGMGMKFSQNVDVVVVGGGLAGCEAAWQIAEAGYHVCLFEMRPERKTEAHDTDDLAELVCSNSLKSLSEESAPGLLKHELQHLGSFILKAAFEAKVPGGQALTVDRKVFAKAVTKAISEHPRIHIERREILDPIAEADGLPQTKGSLILLASGPLTSPALCSFVESLCGDQKRLFFYDAIAPILDADSIDKSIAFEADRYGKGSADYLNLPFSKDEYEAFITAAAEAEKMPLHGFEDTKYFESCLPIEVMIERGRETLRFGPMKPVGLVDPRTGQRPWAAVQLRMENTQASMYSMVGFQTKMKWPEQKRVFRMIPGLKDAEFHRFGSIHRNTYVNSPKVLNSDLSFKSLNRIFLAGQITGVEGYTESTSMGMMAAKSMISRLRGQSFVAPNSMTMIGALLDYVTKGGLGNFQPMNCNFGLLPAPTIEAPRKKVDKSQKKLQQCVNARQSFSQYVLNQPI